MSIIENPKYSSLVKDDEVVLNKHVDQLRWGVVKFISPENMIEKRMLFDLNRFLFHNVNQQLVDMSNNIVMNLNNSLNLRLEAKIAELRKSDDKSNHLLADTLSATCQDLKMDEDVEATRILRQYSFDNEALKEQFIQYQLEHRDTLEREFAAKVTPCTSIRGFKMSGAYPSLEEARTRAQHVNQNIEPHINAYVVPLNVWVPWDPNPDGVQDQEYMLDDLNDLMSKYRDNAEAKNKIFEKRKRDLIDKAQQSNNNLLREQVLASVEAGASAASSEVNTSNGASASH